MARQSLKECIDDYLLEKAAKATRRAYELALRSFLDYLKVAALQDLAGVDRGAVIRFRNHLREERQRAPAYVNRQLSALSGFFKWLLAEGEIRANPCDLVRRYKVSDESRTEGLTEDEVQAMIEATKDGTLRGLRDRAILTTLYYEGLRRGSLARLEMRDLRVHRQVLVLRDTKTSDYKEIPLRREGVKAIEDYLAVLDTEMGLSPGERDPIFVSFSDRSRGRRLSPEMVLLIVKKRAAQAGIGRRIVGHSFRPSPAPPRPRPGPKPRGARRAPDARRAPQHAPLRSEAEGPQQGRRGRPSPARDLSRRTKSFPSGGLPRPVVS